MRVLILSDIHANADALSTVLSSAGSVDAAWCLGDLVGYGPDPNECIAKIKELPNLVCLQGNHDAAATGHLALEGFNAEARASIEWLRGCLTDESRAFLETLEPHTVTNGVSMAHASPRQPMLEYLLDAYSAAQNFQYFENDFCFVGHTHVPLLFFSQDRGVTMQVPAPDTEVLLAPRCIANPGSVGQPRDRDPRASCAIWDTDAQTVEICRVPYDIPTAQSKIRAAGLPRILADRLTHGI